MVVQLSAYSTFVLWLQFGYGRSVAGRSLAEMNKLHSDSVCSRDVVHSVCSWDVVQKNTFDSLLCFDSSQSLTINHFWYFCCCFWFFAKGGLEVPLGFIFLYPAFRWVSFLYIQHRHVKAYYHLLAECVCCDVTIWEFFLHTCMHAHMHAHAYIHKHTHQFQSVT